MAEGENMGSYMHTPKRKVYERIPDLEYNSFLDTDSYKTSHWIFYPKGMTKMFSYLESRGGKYQNVMFAGLQIIVNKYLAKKPTMAMFEEFKEFMGKHGPTPNLEQMKEIAELGYWPVRIRAVKEGSVVPVSNVLVTIESTNEKYAWVANYLEAMIQRVWGPTTVATVSYHCRKICQHYLELTAPDLTWLKFMLQDFGARGVSVYEGAEILGAMHTFNFAGSDTMPGVRCANHYYKDAMAAFSVNAMEHSTVTIYTRNKEIEAYKAAIEASPEGAILSIVIDSYDYKGAIKMIHSLLPSILDKNLKIVFRPDSGNPPDIMKEATLLIEELFGTTMNVKGFKEFNYGIHLLYGDGINEGMIHTLLKQAYDMQFAATNFLFGMGGALLQGVTRDTQKFAVKCSAATVDGKEVEVYKDPSTDPGKKSKKGRLDLEKRDGKYQTVQAPAQFGSELDLVFEDGLIYRQQTLSEIRKIAHDEF